MSAAKAELLDDLVKGYDAAQHHFTQLEELHLQKVQVYEELIEYLEEMCRTLKQ